MTGPVSPADPRLKARVAGLLYVVLIGLGGFAEFFTRINLMVSGNAAATAANIEKSQTLFRLGLAADIIGTACYIAVTVILYELFKPVSRSVSLLAAFFSLAGCVVLAANLVNHVAPMLLLGGAAYQNVFTPTQLDAMALTALRLHAYGYNIAMVFFALYCLLLGYLIIRSTFFPRLIGALLVFAGLTDLSNSFSTFLDLPIPYIGLPALIGEGSLALWLLAVGVNVTRWNEQAGTSRWTTDSDAPKA
jgi:hypothetical protein